ncbi:MAG: alkaline phosphatase family protein [Cyanobacteria bacterium J06626_14]
MANKVILIILDGLRFDVARDSMGYLGHLLEAERASFYKVQAELPSLSRPLYEVLLTGTPVSVNGIGANDVVRLSRHQSIFHLAIAQGLTTAAAAYSWFSELYNQAPFDLFTDREQHNTALPIQHGLFYWDDSYPDSHLFADAEMLIQKWMPDFMLVHPMGIDHAGHCYGADTAEYRGQALSMDSLLAKFLPRWIQAGYSIVITADHGMNADGNHGGLLPDVRETPLFCMGNGFIPGRYVEENGLPQLAIAPLICQLLNIPFADAMRSIPVPGYQPKVSLLHDESETSLRFAEPVSG